ncbi:Methionyl-tRNA formyltransferase [Basidiobolus meristosporus CBS 931.73]|uniref:Methionyl-tRNA formyltransferase, mitochondrial n=1 Tax=Basidiobolus meristosporus CBS 931.73 TaxID=1314790 RepID=A0A1Y1YNJ6_9FUNG|nr:Methionyl-tRNA formyltransferase [Basidiobolus meristosporus CBS 931.73]|eukprot:ORX99581.1 Methionyl-tRNA formyltransferase [Basidiobolus meristosporus CBS 931.73]
MGSSLLLRLNTRPPFLSSLTSNFFRTRSFPRVAGVRTFCTSKVENQGLRILFFGTDNFSLASLKRLVEYKKKTPDGFIKSLDVVTPPDQRRGRGLKIIQKAPLKIYAEEEGLSVFHPPPKTMKGWEMPKPTQDPTGSFDLGVVVSFGYFLPSRILRSFTKGAVNVHPSLLPKYRGASPIQYAILNGDEETGVSIMELHEEIFDAGRILKQVKVPMPKEPFYHEMEAYLGEVGSKALFETVSNFEENKRNALSQDISKVTLAPKISKEMALIDWKEQSAEEIYRRFRAIGAKFPLTSTFRDSAIQLMNIRMVEPSADISDACPGTIILDRASHSIQVVCKEGTMIQCDMVKLENKKACSAKDFINGYNILNGQTRFAN